MEDDGRINVTKNINRRGRPRVRRGDNVINLRGVDDATVQAFVLLTHGMASQAEAFANLVRDGLERRAATDPIIARLFTRFYRVSPSNGEDR